MRNAKSRNMTKMWTRWILLIRKRVLILVSVIGGTPVRFALAVLAYFFALVDNSKNRFIEIIKLLPIMQHLIERSDFLAVE